MHQDTVTSEFTEQAESFNASPVANARSMLGDLVGFAQPRAGERWLESACGPGLISRELAPRVGAVHGIDTTPAMVELARREAAAAGLVDVTFSLGDAAESGLPERSFDGAITRFSLHHIPLPGRVVGEMARVVRTGGNVVVTDHVGDEDAEALVWSQEIERLRDPSHWGCLTVSRLRSLGSQAGLRLEDENLFPLEIDYEDWLVRGSGGIASRALIERSLTDRPAQARCFGWGERDGRRTLQLVVWMARLRRL